MYNVLISIDTFLSLKNLTMNSTRLLSRVRHIRWPSGIYCPPSNIGPLQCSLHISSPRLSGNAGKDDGSKEQPHMRKADKKDSEKKRRSDYMMDHEIYSKEELHAIKVTHKKLESWQDRVAWTAVRILRFSFDTFTGYVHQAPRSASDIEQAKHRPKGKMDEKLWLRRIIFLESIAGVPGMVAGMSRHMKSLRTMQRDHGWIHTLLAEAENERMHLLTFLELRNPGRLFRLFVLFGQGVFFNAFFLTYVLSPRICHRFVGFLEEEAVITYTRCLEDLDAGLLPIWSKTPAPQIAKSYWQLSDGAMMRDVLLAVRADEATHRQVNHKLADVGPREANPFVKRDKEEHDPPNRKEQDEIDTAGKK